MPDTLTIDRAHSALLIMDYQVDIVARAPEAEALVKRAATVLAAARSAELPVIYIVVGFRPGYPEVSPRNVGFAALKQAGRLSSGSPDVEVHHAVAPQPGDITVVKHRVGAFAGTDLDMLLRAEDIDTLVVLGIATSGVVLSTVRHAADADYRLIVVEDCCADVDPGVHRCLMDKVFPRQATVAKAEEVAGALAVSG
jgi:nicotinamidase-related amidase